MRIGLFAPLALLLALPSPALANGQSTHIWISVEALARLPDGPVRDLLSQPDLRSPLVNGTMFPDWGYASGDRDHGEASHWEPFQTAYLRWIQDNYAAPYTDAQAAPHVAFLFGMASHGMADEHFDSLFMERSRCYDPGWEQDDVASLDTASDVLFMAQVGGIPAPEPFLPTDALATVYATVMPDQPLDLEGLAWGNQLLHVAVASVDALRQNEERIATFTDLYPWSTERFQDESTPGSPPDEAEVVARTWLRLWDRLQGTATFDDPVLKMSPAPGSYEHPLDATTPEARVHLAFAHGVRASTLDTVTVTDPDGASVDADVAHFYGDLSHAVLIRPTSDWELDTEYLVTVDAGVTDIDGLESTAPWTATFSTGPTPEPVDPPGDDDDDDAPAGCGASVSPAAPSLLLFLPLAFVRRRARR